MLSKCLRNNSLNIYKVYLVNHSLARDYLKITFKMGHSQWSQLMLGTLKTKGEKYFGGSFTECKTEPKIVVRDILLEGQ